MVRDGVGTPVVTMGDSVGADLLGALLGKDGGSADTDGAAVTDGAREGCKLTVGSDVIGTNEGANVGFEDGKEVGSAVVGCRDGVEVGSTEYDGDSDGSEVGTSIKHNITS